MSIQKRQMNLASLKEKLVHFVMVNYDPRALDTVQRDDTLSIRQIPKTIIKGKPVTYSSLLLEMVKIKFKKDSDFYHAIGMSRQEYSRIISKEQYIPKKETVLKTCIGLQLGHRDSQLLLESSGYAFSNAIPRDIVIKFCIEEKIYEPMMVDALLDAQAQPVLFAEN